MDPEDNTSLRVASFACYLDKAKDNIIHKVLSSQDTINNPVKRNSNDSSTIVKPPFSITFSNNPRENKGHLHERTLTNLRVDSFSSYLHAKDDIHDNNNFVFEVPGPIEDPTTAFAFFSQDLPMDGSGEISIFGADKYFNMKLDNKRTDVVQNPPKHKPSDPARPNAKPPGSPSLKSEASTSNSRSTLIKEAHKKPPQAKPKKTFGRKIFTGFGCRGPCFAKKSVHVSPAATPTRWIPNPGTDRIVRPGKELHPIQIDLDESRHSIEVFGSRRGGGGATAAKSKWGSDIVAKNMERKLSMLTWDAIPKGQSLPTNSPTVTCDDMASEASSDLFEIDNISGSMYHFLTNSDHLSAAAAGGDVINGVVSSSCIMSPSSSQYAPSEASIQWSVVTASAAPADFSAAPSDVEAPAGMMMSVAAVHDRVVVQRNEDVNGGVSTTNCRIIAGKEPQRMMMYRAGGILGCKNDRSVDVAAENRCCRKQQGHERSSRNYVMKMDHIDTLHLPMKSYPSRYP